MTDRKISYIGDGNIDNAHHIGMIAMEIITA